MMHSSILKGWVGRGALSLALLAGAVAVFLMTGGLGEGQERCPADTVCIEYPEEGSGAVIAFTALDPEEEDVTWDLRTGDDAGDFEIIEGRLTFAKPPDYEAPVDGNRDNVYAVTIEATDTKVGPGVPLEAGRADFVARSVQVTVTNVEEPGEVDLTTLQPQEGVAITAMLTDLDGKPRENDDELPISATDEILTGEATTKWQWSRSTRVSGSWTDIEDDETTTGVTKGQRSSYTPTEDDVGMYLRATATYIDGQCEPCAPKKTAHAISANPVQADPRNKDPEFLDEKGKELTSTTRSVAENSAVGTAVGAPVTATDPGFDGRQETLTYVLSGGGDFDIDSGTGQIRVRDELDYEDQARSTHEVSVSATDPSGGTDTIQVNISVTDVDEAPMITAGSTSVDYNENTPVDEEVAGYTAGDPDGDHSDSLKWSLSGQDAARFAIGNRGGVHGQLTFRESPDYEAPTDSGRDNVYNVTVEVTDRGGSKATRDVTVHVENVDEPGLFTVTNLHPQVGTRITPTLTDPDTPISNLIWTWEIDGNVESRANAYTPKSADEDEPLEVKVTYTDGTGERRSMSVESLSLVQPRPSGGNQSPRFPTTTLTRLTVFENELEGVEVGGPVTAEDQDGVPLTYSISGGDSAFSINQDTGQIMTRRELDREKKSSYRVTVTAEDPSGARDTHSLTIAVDNVEEPPVITSGAVYIYYAENGRGNVAAYRAEDPEGGSIDWSLDEANKEFFTFAGGVLKFKNSPDHEGEPEYTVTVHASDGSAETDTEEVTIKVTNVDEEGTVTFDHGPREGIALTATLVDPDGSESDHKWQWARASSRNGRFIDIQEENRESYTPVQDDTGKYLRATVTYTDAHGGGKSAYATSQNRTQWKPSGAPQFLGPDGEDLGNTDKREVNENARAGTNVGAPVAATDIGNRGTPENLTYELGGTNVGSFDIDQRTGQIKVKRETTLDHEKKESYTVTVTASDPSDTTSDPSMDSITVTINVIDVNEAPVMTLTETAITGSFTGNLKSGFTHPELAEDDTALKIPFEGDDPETDTDTINTGTNDTTLTWTLAGTDADDFKIVNGDLTFKSGPDFEAATDSGRNNVYEVTVQAADEAGNTASQRVRITVENVQEAGSITLSHTQPEARARLTASLSDPDKAKSVSWQWYRANVSDVSDLLSVRCDDPSAIDNNCLIYRATSPSYNPDGGDENSTEDLNQFLTVVASYSDGAGNEQIALESTNRAVRAKPDENAAPEFLNATSNKITRDARVVSEDAGKGDVSIDVGDPVTATDPNALDTSLVYSLSAGDVRFFTINRTSGQIMVGAGTELDYETKKSYRVTVKAVDPSGVSGTISVTINVTDVDETPTLTRKGLVAVGRGSVSYPENSRNTVAEYSALGPNAGSVSWRLTGRDASDFSMNSRGALTFRSTPNYEAPADSDRNNTYELTITARSGREQDEFNVTVDVYNVDEEGEVRLSPTRGDIGTRITATLTDRDGTPTSISWEWARSADGMTGWTPVPGTNSDRYILDSDDRGFYVQATAYYTDPEGGGKSASAITTAAVQEDDDGRVTLSETRPAVGDRIRATLTDPDGSITNTRWQWAYSSDGQSGWSDINGATSETYTVTTGDTRKFLRATVNYDDGDGADKDAEAVTSVAVGVDDDGSVSLSPSSPTVEETVTATLTDPDGGVTGASWQWASSSTGTSNWSYITGANSRTYTVVTGDLGNYLRATVSYDDAAGPGKTAEAITAAAVTEDDDGSVTLSPSSPEVGETITTVLSDPDGRVTGVTWTWAFSSNGTTNWRTIIGENSSTYTTVTADVGSYLRATASYTDAAGPGKSAEAVTTAAVTEDDDGSVTLSSTGTSDGDRVTATLTDPDGRVTGITWQWASSPNGSSGWLDILNATSATYTPITTDVGRYLRATATYTDAVGPGKSAEAVTAAAVTPDDDGTVTLSTRTPEVGSEITATLSDPDGGVTGATWQWAKSSNGSTGWTDIQGAASASYTPGRSDAGAFLRATASYDDAVGTGKSAQAATSSGVAQMELLSEYDANRDGSIERSEAIRAVSDYFGGQISKDDVLAVLVLYFSG